MRFTPYRISIIRNTKLCVYSKLNVGLFSGSGTKLGDTIRGRKISEFLSSRGFTVVDLSLGTSEGSANSSNSMNLKPLLKLARPLASLPPIIHLDLIRQSKKLEHMIQRHKIDVLQCETTFPAYVGTLAARQSKIPVIFDMHGLSAEQALMEGKPKFFVNFVSKIQSDTLEHSSHTFVVSDLHKKHLQSKVPPQKMTVVPNAAEIRPICTKNSEAVNVVFGGIFAYWENIQTYIRASTFNKKHPQINFYLAGDGPLRGQLLGLIKRLGSPMKYLGRLSSNEALSFFDTCHIGILPSSKDIAREIACPIKLFDYMSCGMAVVSENIGWWPQLIVEHDAGKIVEHGNPAEMYMSIQELALNHQKRTLMSENGRRLIREQYTWEKQLSKMEKVYDNLS